jgi:hypothetical protein
MCGCDHTYEIHHHAAALLVTPKACVCSHIGRRSSTTGWTR